MCGFSEWTNNRWSTLELSTIGVELECFCNILHGSDGVWAQTGGKPVKSMWKEYTTSFRRVWLGNLYELVLCCANTYEMQIMNAMNAHRGV